MALQPGVTLLIHFNPGLKFRSNYLKKKKLFFLGGCLDLKSHSTATATSTMLTHEEVVFSSSEDENTEESGEVEASESSW